MKVGIVFYGGYPWDRGVDQLAQSLRQVKAYPIVLASSHRTKKKEKKVNSIPVVYIPSDHSLTNLKKIQSYHFPFNPFWKNWLIKLGRQLRLDAMIVRESILSWSVLASCSSLNIPAFMDMRENISAMYRMHDKGKNYFYRIFRHPKLVRYYECYNISGFKQIFTVSYELKQWLVEEYNLPLNKISILENTPSESFLKIAQHTINQGKKKYNDVIRLVYAGMIKEPKGIGDIVEAFPKVLNKNLNIRIRIIGEGPYLPALKAKTKELSIENFVEFFPLLNIPEYISSLIECDVGLETSWLNELTHLTIPGKLFEYMAVGLPVLSSARRPVKRILQKIGCGKVYKSRNPDRIAEAILDMIKNRIMLQKMGEKAKEAVLQRYNFQSNLETINKFFGS
jgi:glycosyltransferase involved in cell wall biosynthesis